MIILVNYITYQKLKNKNTLKYNHPTTHQKYYASLVINLNE